MNHFRSILAAIITSVAVGVIFQPALVKADIDTNTVPDFKEIYDLIRTHLAGESETELNRAAVMGLLNQLHTKVSLGESKSNAPASTATNMLVKSALYDGPVAYLRISRVRAGLLAQMTNSWNEFSGTNSLKGVVLDLRYAQGQDYSEATAVAQLFISQEKPLLDWGSGLMQSQIRTNAITLPLAVLINNRTSGAAEALAAILHQQAQAILIGSSSAGEAAVSQEFALKDGQSLRIATSEIKLGNGEMLSAQGVKPDIQVTLSPEDEQSYFADPFKEITMANPLGSFLGDTNTSTNKTRPKPLNEAELMRQRKLQPGIDLEDSRLSPPPSNPDTDIEKPVVRDPVLGRALDLIKGISYLRHNESR